MSELFIPQEAQDVIFPLLRESKDAPLYLVGGFVRDLLLKRHTFDIDILTFDDPEKLLKRAGFKYFVLDEERKIYRAISGKYRIDICAPRAKTLKEDLQERDFTINAMAWPLWGKGKLIDPWGGYEDLNAKIIRLVSPWAIESDPLRILRAFRLSLTLGFRISTDTLYMCKKAASLITKVAPERIKEEICLILSHPMSFKAFCEMKRYRILDVLFPEIAVARGMPHGKWKGIDLSDHFIYTLQSLEEIILALYALLPSYHEKLKELLELKVEGDYTYLCLLKLAALIHDIGKPKTMVERENEITFWGHDKQGGEMVKEIAQRLALGKKASAVLEKLVAHHMWLHLLARVGEITTKAKGRFFRKLSREGVLLILLSLSDSLSSSGQRGFFYLFPYAQELMNFYYEIYLKEESMQKPLLDGNEIMKLLSIGPGPDVGKALASLLDAQMAGEVKTKEEAKEYIKRIFIK